MDQQAWVVMKFGGTSVASVDRWTTIKAQAIDRLDAGERPVVVCSAISGVSDAIEDILSGCASGHPEQALSALRAKHQELANALGVDLDQEIGADLQEIEDQVRGASLIREVTPRLHARLMAMGERMSTRLGAAFLRQSGVDVTWVDAREHLRARETPNVPRPRAMLSAEVNFAPDPELQVAFSGFAGGSSPKASSRERQGRPRSVAADRTPLLPTSQQNSRPSRGNRTDVPDKSPVSVRCPLKGPARAGLQRG